MTQNNLTSIQETSYLLNLKLYSTMKELIQSKLTDSNLIDLFKTFQSNINEINRENKIQLLLISIKGKSDVKEQKEEFIRKLFLSIKNDSDQKVICLAIKLVLHRKIILEEAKETSNEYLLTISNQISNKLSLEYDSIYRVKPYSVRVILALLLKILENQCHNQFLLESTSKYKKDINLLYLDLQPLGLELSSIYQIIMDEVLKQSGVSEAGGSYESLIYEQLIANGIDESQIKTHHHDINDSTVEYDFLINLNNKKIGISAKRTLRERYKQNHKETDSLEIDLLILITLGIDLNEDKLNRITSKGTIVFVADELKNSKDYFKNNKKVYPGSKLNKVTLIDILNNAL